MPDSFTLGAVGDALSVVTSRHASLRDLSDNYWLVDEDLVADLHPADRYEAARDLLDRLAAQGFVLHRAVPEDGNSLGTRIMRCAQAMLDVSESPDPIDRIYDITRGLVALAAEVQDRENMVVPAHLRLDRVSPPPGVVPLDAWRARV
jgi:hypothetical protein